MVNTNPLFVDNDEGWTVEYDSNTPAYNRIGPILTQSLEPTSGYTGTTMPSLQSFGNSLAIGLFNDNSSMSVEDQYVLASAISDPFYVDGRVDAPPININVELSYQQMHKWVYTENTSVYTLTNSTAPIAEHSVNMYVGWYEDAAGTQLIDKDLMMTFTELTSEHTSSSYTITPPVGSLSAKLDIVVTVNGIEWETVGSVIQPPDSELIAWQHGIVFSSIYSGIGEGIQPGILKLRSLGWEAEPIWHTVSTACAGPPEPWYRVLRLRTNDEPTPPLNPEYDPEYYPEYYLKPRFDSHVEYGTVPLYLKMPGGTFEPVLYMGESVPPDKNTNVNAKVGLKTEIRYVDSKTVGSFEEGWPHRRSKTVTITSTIVLLNYWDTELEYLLENPNFTQYGNSGIYSFTVTLIPGSIENIVYLGFSVLYYSTGYPPPPGTVIEQRTETIMEANEDGW